jgi:hypothetical protein
MFIFRFLSVQIEHPPLGADYNTPPGRKPRKLFSIVSGPTASKVIVRTKYASGPEKSGRYASLVWANGVFGPFLSAR